MQHHQTIQVIMSNHLKWETSASMLTNAVLKMEDVSIIVKIRKGHLGKYIEYLATLGYENLKQNQS